MEKESRIPRILLYACALSLGIFAVLAFIAAFGEYTRFSELSLILRQGNRFARYYPAIKVAVISYSALFMLLASCLFLSAAKLAKRLTQRLFSVFISVFTVFSCVLFIILACYFFALGWVNLAVTRSVAMLASFGPLALLLVAFFVMTLALRSRAKECFFCIVNGTEPQINYVVFCLFTLAAVSVLLLFSGGRGISIAAQIFFALALNCLGAYLCLVKGFFKKKSRARTLYFQKIRRDKTDSK